MAKSLEGARKAGGATGEADPTTAVVARRPRLRYRPPLRPEAATPANNGPATAATSKPPQSMSLMWFSRLKRRHRQDKWQFPAGAVKLRKQWQYVEWGLEATTPQHRCLVDISWRLLSACKEDRMSISQSSQERGAFCDLGCTAQHLG
eukprot:CAMPEP_0115295942 /NCGR_PEP_ID=MMETSP0270-20121206/66978_1 /TAXON_ID=71861 /ORGANISM="Scrippsiella trochoidea, Strain CCMP3099" /LENGTH=147 /DNA_ID=CAMNT_0002713555 /DNA_START=150 /DNA_END=594 /DNA_ORIENTATION=+